MKLIKTPDDTLLVTLADVKADLRITGDGENKFLQSLIRAASRACEAYIGYDLLTATYAAKFTAGAAGDEVKAFLPMNWRDVTIEPSSVYSMRDGILAIRATYAGPVTVSLAAGVYGDGSEIPADLLTGIRQYVVALYENRGEVEAGIPLAVESLWLPHKSFA